MMSNPDSSGREAKRNGGAGHGVFCLVLWPLRSNEPVSTSDGYEKVSYACSGEHAVSIEVELP